jgi:hypothetical protein
MLPKGKATGALLNGLPATPDGYVLVQKAIGLAREQRSEMEFAASLMAPDSAARDGHRVRAAAAPSPLLAANLDVFGSF